ncbi:MAG: hypothetical protein RBR06_02430 [Desulfuromonadaceae bacterium]|nr:hypothetical protein [Desulfuromonadaceae bacterium]
MPKPDMHLWQSVALLFMSKFVTATTQAFVKKELINPKNIGLAGKFAAMLGSETNETEVKQYLNIALKELEREGVLQRTSTGTMHLSPEGITRMNAERTRAMTQIAANFPNSVPQSQTEEVAGGENKLN